MCYRVRTRNYTKTLRIKSNAHRVLSDSLKFNQQGFIIGNVPAKY